MSKLTLGNRGESLAAVYLKKNNFEVLERNYNSAVGEIDIIALKGEQYHFVEVKTRSSLEELEILTLVPDSKKSKIQKTIYKYFDAENIETENYQMDLIVILLNERKKLAKIYYYPAI
jgi:putative endonuclease